MVSNMQRREGMCVLVAVLLTLLHATVATSEEGIREYLHVIEQHELRGRDCDELNKESTALGCYQLLAGALRDIGFKDAAGRWTAPACLNVNSDEEFRHNRLANDVAMKMYTTKNWTYLSRPTKDAIGREIRGIRLDEASLLAGAHLLGPTGIGRCIDGSLHPSCISDRAVRDNSGDRMRFHEELLARMGDAHGLDVAEFTIGPLGRWLPC